MPRQPISADQTGQILRLRDAGLTQKVIALEVGVSQTTVSNYLQVHRPKGNGDGPEPRHGLALLDVPVYLDGEPRRVVEYVNQEIRRWNRGDRIEAVDLIVDAARSRLRTGR